MAVTKQQVRVFMAQRSDGKTQTAAAAKAGISERTARRIDAGQQLGVAKPDQRGQYP
jgi:phage terminase small subunit